MQTAPYQPIVRLGLYGKLFAVLLCPGLAIADAKTGEQIYSQRCATCHGPSGEGTDENYPKPLQGKRSVDQLSRLIARTMPKDAKVKCTAEEAEKVAAYIYKAFYSKAAQDRNQAPRIELSRLTVRQYRQAVADLIGGFRTPGQLDSKHGLHGTYFKLYGFRTRNRSFERLDPTVRFDFGESSPDPGKLEPSRFCIRWEGSVLPPETGEYEFIIHTEHAARLWVNEVKQPLLDASVKSGMETTYRASHFFLGGRAYPLRLEFAKGKQGDPDGKKNETKLPAVKASIVLEWKPPGGVPEVIPSRNLVPARTAETFVLTTPFQPDDRSLGYERGTSISRAWEQATTEAAIEVAAYVVKHLAELSGVPDDAADRAPRLRDFCRRFAERAFRRPLTPELQRLYIDHQFEGRDPESTVKRVVLLVLQSPRFLYREIGGDAYDVASRIAFGLCDSLPDGQLLQAAAAGQLAAREQVARQAERLVADPRTQAKLREFLLQWLKVDQIPELSKNRKQFPGFDQAVAADLRTSLELFLDDVLWSEGSDFRQLLLADSLYLNGRLARIYGGDLPAEAPFQKVTLKTGERAGILSHPYLMATFAYTEATSPIHRGVFLARNVLGRALRPPPEAFTPLAADLHPDLTTRERVILQTKPESCQSCHGMINPLGFTLEHFDAVGRYRDKDEGRSIDATGTYQTRTGQLVKFAGLRELASFLADSPETHSAFVEHLFHYLVKQPIRAFGPRKLDELRQRFVQNRYNVRKLMVDIIAESAVMSRQPSADSNQASAGR
jgi:cytochrome c553